MPETNSPLPSAILPSVIGEAARAIGEGEAVATLRALYPGGVTITASKVEGITAAPKRMNLEQLAESTRRSKTVRFQLHGELVEVEVHGLNAAEQTAVDKLGDGVIPPQKFKDKERRIPDGYDDNDPVFIREATRVAAERRALRIRLGMADGDSIQGDNVNAWREWLESRFTPQVLELLSTAIRQLTSDPLAEAHFI